ncbi:MAG: hypothetical protein ACUVUC_07175 [Thermoguttaceae bacterium]
MLLDREEYIEQAYFFRTFRERMQEGVSSQELLAGIRQEILSTTKLPMALEFMAGELKHTGGFGSAMARLSHYFTPFQTFVVCEAEKEDGRFDFRIALEILEREAEYRAKGASLQGIFLYQFETLCRNRLGYDRGLEAIAADPVYDEAWRQWVLTVRRQVGIIDIADMIYVRSEHFRKLHGDPEKPILFGEKEGKIALANRRKDPLFLFSALARHLGYPSVPRPRQQSSEAQQLALLQRRIDRLEMRIRLCEEELRGGINLARFYAPPKREGE